ncbi:MAG: hypothetical protein IPM54_12155 [Polyangiaceae bacterium]|nr:hypothetical protein [Polyangiaceae bacterium]
MIWKSAAQEKNVIARRIEHFGVFPAEAERAAGVLSGGNQQKIVMARALDRIEASPDRAVVVLATHARRGRRRGGRDSSSHRFGC